MMYTRLFYKSEGNNLLSNKLSADLSKETLKYCYTTQPSSKPKKPKKITLQKVHTKKYMILYS